MSQETNNKDVNSRYNEFQKELMGAKYYLDGKEISKSEIFWMRERLLEDTRRMTRITAVPN